MLQSQMRTSVLSSPNWWFVNHKILHWCQISPPYHVSQPNQMKLSDWIALNGTHLLRIGTLANPNGQFPAIIIRDNRSRVSWCRNKCPPLGRFYLVLLQVDRSSRHTSICIIARSVISYFANLNILSYYAVSHSGEP